MLNRLRAGELGHISPRGWRSLAGLAVMLASIIQSAQVVRSYDGPLFVPAVGSLAVVMSAAWFLQLGPAPTFGVWLLGGASTALALISPGPGAVIGVVSAIVISGLRLPSRQGAVAAISLGCVFMLAYGSAARWANLPGLGFTAIGLGFAYLATVSVRRIREERERAEALLAELQQTRAAEIERAALAERARIAREIHDVLAHTLSALAVQLEGTRMLVEQRPGDPAAVSAVERAHRLASEGLGEARRAIGALRGDSLPGPDGLERLVEEFSEATGTPGHFEVSGQQISLSSEAQLAIYRTAQEALTNVRKHAHATSVEVSLRYGSDGAELLVVDHEPGELRNGVATGTGGYGLLGMRERAELVGGSLEAGSFPDGFRVRLWLPRI